jgi:tyrosyl-tRNA synthetase
MESDKDSISKILDRGTEEVIDRAHLESRLKEGKVLRIKMGIDPTSPHFHLGHLTLLLKLRDFQNLGHKIVLIIGNFTGLVGDTSDKESERPMLSEAEVEENARTYVDQASKIIDIDKAEILHNADWLSKLGYLEIGRQANIFSLHEFTARENVSRRLEQEKRVSLRELLYPLMQAYDSVEVKSDVEIGGTDQRFNLLAGREMQRFYGQEPQDILTAPLLEGLDGRKMSSSYNNTIELTEAPNDIFGKVMSLRDELIIRYFKLATRVETEVINEYQECLNRGDNPRDVKLKLAFQITRICHSEDEAQKAQDFFIETFSDKKTPTDIESFAPKDYNIVSVLVDSGLVASRAEAKRVIAQGGVKVDNQTITSLEDKISPGSVLQKGKISFVKIE